LTYLSGYRIFPSERLTCLVLTARGESHLLVPVLEAPRARAHVQDVPIRTWSETEDPVARVRELVGSASSLALADQMWASFVLPFSRAFPDARLVTASEVLRPLRVRKDDDELSALRDAGAAADRAFERLVRDVAFAGRREVDVARDLTNLLLEEGHEEVKFCIVGSGPNGASPHHDAGVRVIREGDVVVCDFGGTVRSYTSDLTRSVFVGAGAIPDEVKRVHDAVRRAQEAGYQAARRGARAEDVDRAARRTIAEAGYGAHFIHRTGHGIGLDGHEDPYLVEGNAERLEPGMTFSIEPGVYFDGRFGVRIEDIVALGDAGPEPLNRVDRALARVR
jgi:D-alanyl-D-alanine dipeptidase